MIERDAGEDPSDTRPFRRDDELYFVRRTVVVVGCGCRSEVSVPNAK